MTLKGEELSSEQKEKLKEVLDTYADVLTATPGCTNLASHTITTGLLQLNYHPIDYRRLIEQP